MKGESLYKISALMGNSPEICQRHYAALIPETMVDSVEFDLGLKLFIDTRSTNKKNINPLGNQFYSVEV